MSLTMRKNQAEAGVSTPWDRARNAAMQAAPLARNASTTAAQGVQGARDWAAPRLVQGFYLARDQGAPRVAQGFSQARDWAVPRAAQGFYLVRLWAAPRIDQAGRALEESVAPKVSQALTAAARRVEPPAPAVRRRVWPRLIGALLAATVIGGVVAAILRGRSAGANDSLLADEEPAGEAAEPEAQAGDDPVMTDAGIAGNGNRAAP